MLQANSFSGERTQSRARRAALRALIIFLLLMIALTVVNGTLNELTVAAVDKVYPQRGALEVRIDASGQLGSAQSLAVYAESALPVSDVYAKAGMAVSAGDALFKLDADALKDALSDAEAELFELVNSREKAAGAPFGAAPDESDVDEAQADYDLALARYEQALADAWTDYRKEKADALSGAEADLAAKNQALAWAHADMYEDALTDYAYYQRQVDRQQARVDEAQAELDARIANGDTEARIKSAQSTLNSRKSSLASAVRDRDKRTSVRTYFEKQQEAELAQQQYDEAQAAHDAAQLPAPEAQRTVEKTVDSQRSTMESAKKALTDKQRTARERRLEAQNQDGAIEKKQADIGVLERLIAAGGVVAAPIDAEVVSVAVEQGKTAATDSAAVLLRPKDAPFELRVSVSEDDAGEMSVGDEARISLGDASNYEYISAIVSSADNPGQFDVCFEIRSDSARIGMNAKMEYRRRTQSYDALVPLAALRQDNTGYYVFAIITREGALGAEMTVERRDVSVLERDSTRAAVSGNVSPSDELASRSDRSLSAGDRVRVREGS